MSANTKYLLEEALAYAEDARIHANGENTVMAGDRATMAADYIRRALASLQEANN